MGWGLGKGWLEIAPDSGSADDGKSWYSEGSCILIIIS